MLNGNSTKPRRRFPTLFSLSRKAVSEAIEGEPADETQTDIAAGVMAAQAAHSARKAARDDGELQRYRRRMNAVMDAQAKRFGAEFPEQPVTEDDDMQVFTNSPVVHTTKSGGPPAWLMTAIGAAALAGGVWVGYLVTRSPSPAVVPTPPPVSSGGDLHIQVIKP